MTPDRIAELRAMLKALDALEASVTKTAKPAPLVVRKWIGFQLNGRGEIDARICDYNPGHLAHTYQVEIPVPPEVADHLLRALPCVVLDKAGNPSGPCPEATPNETSEA